MSSSDVSSGTPSQSDLTGGDDEDTKNGFFVRTKVFEFFSDLRTGGRRPLWVFGAVEEEPKDGDYGPATYFSPVLAELEESLKHDGTSVRAYRLPAALRDSRVGLCLGTDEAYYYYTIINPSHFDLEDFLSELPEKNISLDFPKTQLTIAPPVEKIDALFVLPIYFRTMATMCSQAKLVIYSRRCMPGV